MEFNLTPLQWNSAQLNSTEHLCNGIQLNNGIQFNSTPLNTFVMEFNLTPLQWNSAQLNSTEHLCNGIQLNTFAMEFSSTQLN
jgi:hypothetical protein